MSVCCGDLLTLKYFKEITLVAGEEGLYRQVTWPHICTTETISNWVNGGELLFVPLAGQRKDADRLITICKECITSKVAGIVILTGEDYIPQIPQSLIDFAQKSAFPIFQMPWNLKLINVTQEISELIMQQKTKQEKSKNFLERLLYSMEDNLRLEDIAPQYGVSIRPYSFIAILEIAPNQTLPDNLELVLNDLVRTVSYDDSSKTTSTLVSMEYLSRVICLVSADLPKFAEQRVLSITHSLELLKTRYPNIKLILGFGRIMSDNKRLRESLLEAERCLTYMESGLSSESVCRYDQLGIYQLFFKFESSQALKDYYWDNIGCLIESDSKNASEFLATLRCYLFNNCNLVKTAQALFIHRNTLIYRLNAIKGLLSKDLDDAFVRHELFNNILAAEFSQKVFRSGIAMGSLPQSPLGRG